MGERHRSTITVAAERLERAGAVDGDIAASYSADRISEDQPLRKPFRFRGDLWVSTGGGGSRHRLECQAYRLVPLDLFQGTVTTYRGRCGTVARADPKGFYHGMRVRSKGQTFVLTGPEFGFVGDDTVARAPQTTTEEENAMAMTVGEASAVNTLLRFFLGEHPSDREGRPQPVTLAEARSAAGLLAGAAHKKLSAGLDEGKSDKMFDRLRATVNNITCT